ncbi:hypothetical protein [Streptoalloteichus hindustanus]|uniref:Uncharacterized protein n=1 Tax=Streptoalloteichus hindustanus TaxID=2017 RepID=A0A1M4VEK1_STRHI|nr:hypothetical protein [Streptoalloteichus hindustanus]SHE67260.1 hypothetical protein SAMN05444320_101741 [Streptoalloteichus hindustanus]
MSSAVELRAPGPRGIPPLLARLVDDAALFPPGNAPMPDAVRGHLQARTGPHAGVVGLFLCPASRLPELISELVKAKPTAPVGLSLVIDTGMGGVPKAVSIVESRRELLALRMVEMPAPTDVDDVWLERVAEFVPEDAIRVLEPRRPSPGDRAEWLTSIRKVAEHGCWPKLRCGGVTAEAFPSVEEVSDFLAVATTTGVPFKATAGLHHAVRHGDPETGFQHHGFLNLLLATARSLSGRDVRAVLESTDAAALAAEARALPEPAAHAVRAVFSSYGSCSLSEPVEDLEGLGLL